MSLFSATPQAELPYTVKICVCLASSDRTNSSLLGMLAWPSAQPPQAQLLFQAMAAHTLRSVSSWLAAFFPYVSFMSLYSIISTLSPHSTFLTRPLCSFFCLYPLVSSPCYKFSFYVEHLEVHASLNKAQSCCHHSDMQLVSLNNSSGWGGREEKNWVKILFNCYGALKGRRGEVCGDCENTFKVYSAFPYSWFSLTQWI